MLLHNSAARLLLHEVYLPLTHGEDAIVKAKDQAQGHELSI